MQARPLLWAAPGSCPPPPPVEGLDHQAVKAGSEVIALDANGLLRAARALERIAVQADAHERRESVQQADSGYEVAGARTRHSEHSEAEEPRREEAGRQARACLAGHFAS